MPITTHLRWRYWVTSRVDSRVCIESKNRLGKRKDMDVTERVEAFHLLNVVKMQSMMRSLYHTVRFAAE